MPKWGSLWPELLASIILSMAALTAGMGLQIGCFVRNQIQFGSHLNLNTPAMVSGIMGFNPWTLLWLVFLLLLTAAWVISLWLFFRRNRKTVLGWLLTLAPLGVFAFSGYMTILYAYPVCNSF